jgi:SLT domain-containing protein
MGGGGMPMGLGGGGGGLGSGMSIPGLDALSSLTGLGRDHHHATTAGLTLGTEPSGPDADRVRAAISNALDIEGIRDPVARARWEAGMMVAAKRESGFSNRAVNNGDSNAVAGDRTEGTWQFTGATFRSNHEPGTSTSRSDDVAEACAFINYARTRYHVAADASNLAANIQQADPTRPAKGY